LNREEALALVRQRIKNKNLVKHILAVEAVMRALANRFGEDPERWGLAGLLHDIDYEETAEDPQRHSMVGADFIQSLGVEQQIVDAVRSHNEAHGLPRETLMQKALYSADPLTGLIVACALVHPEKRLEPLTAEFVMKRFGEKAFARGASRHVISACADMGLALEEFISIGLDAMKHIHAALGL